MSSVDVLIVGAGVAGTTAAIGLAQQGIGVLLVDRSKLPRHKVCGCCLNSDAVRILDELGLTDALVQAGGKPIQQVELRCNSSSISLSSHGGMSVSRYALDALLTDAALSAGCRVHDQTNAKISKKPSKDDEAVAVICTSPRTDKPSEVRAKVVLVADGLAGSCVSEITQARRTTPPDSLRGYGAHLPANHHALSAGQVVMHAGPGGYVGTVMLEDGTLDIAAAMKPSWVKACGGPAHAAQSILEQSGQPISGLAKLSWKATAPLTGRRERLWIPRVFFLGDSAGYVEPFTGEGMAWAMRSAQALQPIVPRAVQGWDDQLGLDWDHAYKHAVQQRQWRCRLFAKSLRHPRLVSSLIRCANWLPTSVQRTAARSMLPPMFQPSHSHNLPEFAAT